MNIWIRFTGRAGGSPDLLGFTTAPSADEWLAAFTAYFLRQPHVADGTRGLMSGLRFFTPAFVAEIAALSAVAARQPALPGRIPNAIYTATGPIIASVYQNFISRQAERRAVHAACAQAMPTLIAQYTQFDRK